MKRKPTKTDIAYMLLGKAVQTMIIFIPIYINLNNVRNNLFFYFVGVLIGYFIIFLASKFIFHIISRMEKKKIVDSIN